MPRSSAFGLLSNGPAPPVNLPGAFLRTWAGGRGCFPAYYVNPAFVEVVNTSVFLRQMEFSPCHFLTLNFARRPVHPDLLELADKLFTLRLLGGLTPTAIWFLRICQPRKALDNSPAQDYINAMVLTSMREFNRAVPFRPYKIRMVSGESFEVPHPDFISISPKGSFVVLIDEHECPHHLSTLLIESVSPHNNHRARKRGKR